MIVIYTLIDEDKIVYVGQSKNISIRLKCHLESNKRFTHTKLFPCNPKNANNEEAERIVIHKPIYNYRLPRNDRYITVNQAKQLLKIRTEKQKYNFVSRVGILEPAYMGRIKYRNGHIGLFPYYDSQDIYRLNDLVG